tara:strand:- start:209 stop:352 length:144 start_codon:yes stop_codon:yes gene_type:complete
MDGHLRAEWARRQRLDMAKGLSTKPKALTIQCQKATEKNIEVRANET